MSSKVKEDIMDLLDGRRKFEIEVEEGVVKEYFIGTPNAEDVRQADWEHAKTYNRALKEGVFTVSEMMEILKARNIIGEDYDQAGDDLRVKLGEKVVEMERETDKDKRMELALQVARIRENIFQWNQRLSGPMASTCENMANDARVEYLTSAVIQDKDGKRIWPTYEDYKTEKDLAVQTKARFEVMLWLEGVESDFLDRAPENVVIRELMDVTELEESKPNEELLAEVEEAEAGDEAVVEAVEEEKPAPRKRKARKTQAKKTAARKKKGEDKAE